MALRLIGSAGRTGQRCGARYVARSARPVRYFLSRHPPYAGMAELADAADSKSADPCGHGGSTPPPGTIKSISYKVFLRPAGATPAPSSQLCSQLDVQSWHRGIVRCREYGKRKSIEGYSKGTRGAMFG